jgi:hypothetical protein
MCLDVSHRLRGERKHDTHDDYDGLGGHYWNVGGPQKPTKNSAGKSCVRCFGIPCPNIVAGLEARLASLGLG